MMCIDLNSDVGEGVGNELRLMPYLSSCNIACGGHAGNEKEMIKVLKLAKKYAVKIGVHPSYPDRANFGREVMDISEAKLKESLRLQILRLRKLALQCDVQLNHIKPHGALYNKAAQDAATAQLIIDTVLEIDDQLILYVPYNSQIAKMATSQLKVANEGFADREYNEDYSLVSRKVDGAVITKSEEMLAHVLPMIQHNTLTTLSGKELFFKIDTLCVHGDTENAFNLLKDLYKKLIEEGITVT